MSSMSRFTGDAERGRAAPPAMVRARLTTYERLLADPRRAALEIDGPLNLSELTSEQLRDHDVQVALRAYVLARLGEDYDFTPVYSIEYGQEWRMRLADFDRYGRLMGQLDDRIAHMPLAARLAALGGLLRATRSALPERQEMYPDDFDADVREAELQDVNRRHRLGDVDRALAAM